MLHGFEIPWNQGAQAESQKNSVGTGFWAKTWQNNSTQLHDLKQTNHPGYNMHHLLPPDTTLLSLSPMMPQDPLSCTPSTQQIGTRWDRHQGLCPCCHSRMTRYDVSTKLTPPGYCLRTSIFSPTPLLPDSAQLFSSGHQRSKSSPHNWYHSFLLIPGLVPAKHRRTILPALVVP